MSDEPARRPPLLMPLTHEQVLAENAALRKLLADYFDHDWGDKIGMWEELAEKAIGRGPEQT